MTSRLVDSAGSDSANMVIPHLTNSLATKGGVSAASQAAISALPKRTTKNTMKVEDFPILQDATEEDMELDEAERCTAKRDSSHILALIDTIVTARLDLAERSLIASVPGLRRVRATDAAPTAAQAFMMAFGFNFDDGTTFIAPSRIILPEGLASLWP